VDEAARAGVNTNIVRTKIDDVTEAAKAQFAQGLVWTGLVPARRRLQCILLELQMGLNYMQDSQQTPVLSAIGVGKDVADSTGTLSILSDVDLTVYAGETLAIVGASGSGKSTLLSILAGLDTPSHGQVMLAGTDMFALDEDGRAAWRALNLGFVFQNFQLLGHLSALENVMLPLELAGRKDARVAATAMLERVGLSERLRHYPKVMSGGEQQRVALARAFVMRPKLLVADEPTGSLDFATGEAVMNLMFELNQDQGTTLLMVTHDRAIAARCQQRIGLQAGKVVERS
jgi:putative ABC transport system ATP-binding protein